MKIRKIVKTAIASIFITFDFTLLSMVLDCFYKAVSPVRADIKGIDIFNNIAFLPSIVKYQTLNFSQKKLFGIFIIFSDLLNNPSYFFNSLARFRGKGNSRNLIRTGQFGL